MELSELFIEEVERRCPAFELASPRNALERGSQVTLRFADAYPFVQALIDRGVIGDFRPPDVMRFGIAPLYLDARDIVRAAGVMEEVLAERGRDRPRYRQMKAATRPLPSRCRGGDRRGATVRSAQRQGMESFCPASAPPSRGRRVRPESRNSFGRRPPAARRRGAVAETSACAPGSLTVNEAPQ